MRRGQQGRVAVLLALCAMPSLATAVDAWTTATRAMRAGTATALRSLSQCRHCIRTARPPSTNPDAGMLEEHTAAVGVVHGGVCVYGAQGQSCKRGRVELACRSLVASQSTQGSSRALGTHAR